MELENHPSEEQLEEYSRGTLPAKEAERVEEHLLVCPACQDRLADLDAFLDAARQAAFDVQLNPPTALQDGLRGLARMGAAPAILLAAGLTAVLLVSPGMMRRNARAAVLVRLEATRAGLPGVAAPSNRALALDLDASGLPQAACCRLEVVDSVGAKVLERPVEVKSGRVATPAGLQLRAGQYWVRLYESAGAHSLLREYGLEVK